LAVAAQADQEIQVHQPKEVQVVLDQYAVQQAVVAFLHGEQEVAAV
jgi:hypothetical protein